MDKLRKYIQECGGDIVYSDYDKVATLEDLEYNYRYIRFLLSTEAMFIKWLVDNDKINFLLIPNEIKEIGIPMKINGKIMYGFDSSDYYWLLMLLSIQDDPISFLISVLK